MLPEITLTGRFVTLDPLRIDHADALAVAGLDPSLWRLQPKPVETVADMRRYVEAAIADRERGLSLPFVIVDNASGDVIGSTRYMDIAFAHRRLEIGATWLTPRAQRMPANTEAKFLLLRHAFEALDVNRVVFKTEDANEQSKTAILRIGARYEGTFRQHLIAESGRKRDMAYFAILAEEWPPVKASLEERLARYT